MTNVDPFLIILAALIIIFALSSLLKHAEKKEKAKVVQLAQQQREREDRQKANEEKIRIEGYQKKAAALQKTLSPLITRIKTFLKERPGEHFTEIELRSKIIYTAFDDDNFTNALYITINQTEYRKKYDSNSSEYYYYYVIPGK